VLLLARQRPNSRPSRHAAVSPPLRSHVFPFAPCAPPSLTLGPVRVCRPTSEFGGEASGGGGSWQAAGPGLYVRVVVRLITYLFGGLRKEHEGRRPRRAGFCTRGRSRQFEIQKFGGCRRRFAPSLLLFLPLTSLRRNIAGRQRLQQQHQTRPCSRPPGRQTRQRSSRPLLRLCDSFLLLISSEMAWAPLPAVQL
jgi:hypothetical protein